MNKDEKVVEMFLKRLELAEVVYEPDGNIPPDFRVGKSIAVEVRRLNSNFMNGTGFEGLDEKKIPVFQSVSREFEKWSDRYEKPSSYWVFLRMRRPLPSPKRFRTEFQTIIRSHDEEPEGTSKHYYIEPNIEIEIRYFSDLKKQPKERFQFGGETDLDEGGFVNSIAYQNLKLCVSEKVEKLSKHFDRYSRWWLILVDYLDYGVDWSEIAIERVKEHSGPMFESIFILDRQGKEKIHF